MLQCSYLLVWEVCVCAHVWGACVYEGSHACVWKRRSTRVHQEPFILIFKADILTGTWQSPINLGWLVSKTQESSCLPLPNAEIMNSPKMPVFCIIVVLVFMCLFVLHFPIAFEKGLFSTLILICSFYF